MPNGRNAAPVHLGTPERCHPPPMVANQSDVSCNKALHKFTIHSTTYSLAECSQVQMSGVALEGPKAVPDQDARSWKWKGIVIHLAHDILDLTTATIAGIVAVFLFFPVYLVVVLAKTVVRRVKPSPTA